MPEQINPVDTLLSAVRKNGHRVTTAKRTVAEVLTEVNGDLTADILTSAVQTRHPEVSQSTIYRILEEFEELGIVVHAHLGQSAAVAAPIPLVLIRFKSAPPILERSPP